MSYLNITDADLAKEAPYHDRLSCRLQPEIQDDSNLDAKKKKFNLYTMDVSYFSGKMEMYLRYKEIECHRMEPTVRQLENWLAVRSGTGQVPQLRDNRPGIPEEKRYLRDTTYMIEYLETDPQIKKNSLSVIPDCPVQAFFVRLFEDYADEYLWRPAMWYRWEPQLDRTIMGHRFMYEFCRQTPVDRPIPQSIGNYVLSSRQWMLSCFGEDTLSSTKKQVVQDQYFEILSVLEEILSTQPYLLGNRPTLIDFGFMGPFFRHFASDFTPRKIMQIRAPAVHEWVGRLWNLKSSSLKDVPTGFPERGELPANWDRLMRLLPDFLHYYHLNAMAYKAKKPTFDWDNKGHNFHVSTVHYRAHCRMKLQQRYQAIECKETKQRVTEILEKYQLLEPLMAGGVVECQPETGVEPPFCKPTPKGEDPLVYKWPDTPVKRNFSVWLMKNQMHWFVAFFLVVFMLVHTINVSFSTSFTGMSDVSEGSLYTAVIGFFIYVYLRWMSMRVVKYE